MQLVRKLRVPALSCAAALIVCELVSRPYANMAVVDDGTYIRSAQRLASTGHIFYNGVETPILGWQLYLGAAFVKLFGPSMTAVRMSTLLVAALTAIFLQRILVRAGTSERNATLGTLTLVLSPLYLMLSPTFMSDIFGLFAIVVCLYGCLRALQASSQPAALLWLLFAVFTNCVFGTSRQIAWLGTLVMVPSAVWLLRSHRRTLLAGSAMILAGIIFIFGCMHWFSQQPYDVHESLIPRVFLLSHVVAEFVLFSLEIPFLILPVVALFLPEMRKFSRRILLILAAIVLLYLPVAIHWGHAHPNLVLMEPTLGNWVNKYGIFRGLSKPMEPPTYLPASVRIPLTIVSLGGLLGLIASLLHTRHLPMHTRHLAPEAVPSRRISQQQLIALLAPFFLAYCLLLIPRSASFLVDRYALALMVVAVVLTVRYYQDYIQPRIPLATFFLIAGMAFYGVAVTHMMFSYYRARVTLANELVADGVSSTSVDNGWEYNFAVELQHADHINDHRVVLPANAYIPVPKPARGTCATIFYDNTPHIHALYGVAFDPNVCSGPAPFAPVHYSRWPYRAPGTLYVVRYPAPARH